MSVLIAQVQSTLAFMPLSRVAIKEALTALKGGDSVPLADILAKAVRSDIDNLGTLNNNNRKTTFFGNKSTSHLSKPIFLGEKPELKPEADTANESSATTQRASRYPSVLKIFQSSALLSPLDLVALIPKDKRGDLGLEEVIKGRYSSNLWPTGNYYLIFTDSKHSNSFWTLANDANRRLNGSYASFDFVPDFSECLKYVYTPILPDLKNLSRLISLSFKQTGDLGKTEVNSHDRQEVLRKILDKRLNFIRRSDSPISSAILSINESLLLESSVSGKLPQNLPGKPIDRCNCVILRNVPHNIAQTKIKDFLWDLKWYKVDELNLRKVYTDKTSQLSTYVLIFDSPKDAVRCVEKCNHQHLFYDESLPVSEAELLDERI